MKRIVYRLGFAGLCLTLLMTGCVQAPPKPLKKAAVTKEQPKKPYWIGDGVKGKPSIVIVLSEQRAYFYKGDKLVGESTISSGKKGFETPPGQYKVIQKDKTHVSNLYGNYVDLEDNIVQRNVDVTKDPVPEGAEFSGAKMPNFLRFTGGVRNARWLCAEVSRLARLHPNAVGHVRTFLQRRRNRHACDGEGINTETQRTQRRRGG